MASIEITQYHEIGNSSFDSDKNFVIDLVKYHNYRRTMDIEIVNTFYKGQILRYQQRCSEIIANNPNNLARFKTHIDDLWGKYYEYFNLFETYYRDKVLDIENILLIFEVLAEIVCYVSAFDTENFILNYRKYPDMYPLVNDSGHHGYSSYLYGLINNIILVGIPSDRSPYDDYSVGEDDTCPLMFYNHDLFHSFYMITHNILKPDNINNIKYVYYTILRSQNSVIEKELGIFALWFMSHEKYYTLEKFWDSDIYMLFKHENIQLDVDFGIKITESLRYLVTDDDLLKCAHIHRSKIDQLIDHHHNCELYKQCRHLDVIKQVYINIIGRLYGFNLIKTLK
jgi:hypothetical protein